MSRIILLNDHKKESTLIEKARQIRQLKLDRDRAVKAYDAMKKTITQEMGDSLVILDSNGCELITRTSYVKNTFNKDKFEMDFPDIYESYKKPETIWNFNVK
jgi:hypothetical protein